MLSLFTRDSIHDWQAVGGFLTTLEWCTDRGEGNPLACRVRGPSDSRCSSWGVVRCAGYSRCRSCRSGWCTCCRCWREDNEQFWPWRLPELGTTPRIAQPARAAPTTDTWLLKAAAPRLKDSRLSSLTLLWPSSPTHSTFIWNHQPWYVPQSTTPTTSNNKWLIFPYYPRDLLIPFSIIR